MEPRIQKLERQMEEIQRSLLKLPLDPIALGALNQAFISGNFELFNIKRMILTPGNATNPSKEGEMVYHATTPSIKVLLNGVVKTITVT